MSRPSGPIGPLTTETHDKSDLSRVGVVDVGSNSVRLVIFDGATRSPAYFFNEKVLCGLGRGLAETGRLNPEGKARARDALARFQAIAEGMGITPLLAVATAAMRVAEDGPEFQQEIARDIGLDLRVIDGQEEARLAAQGVLLGWPEASGLVCDIGGSSMELARVENGQIGWRRTSPLGPLELSKQDTDPKAQSVQDWIDDHLNAMRDAMPDNPRDMFLVGGSWRAIAKLDMARRNYPLKVLHEYRLTADDLEKTLDMVDSKDATSLRKAAGISGERMSLVPLAAQVLRGIMRVFNPDGLYVSSYGLREGLLYEQMSENLRMSDPLLETCRYDEARSSRVPGFGNLLYGFLRPLWPDATPAELRLIESACLLHDVSWRTHPDYRAEVCFDYATRANLGGLTHEDRVFLGLALLHRYKNSRGQSRFDVMQSLITPEREEQAEILGRAMRFGAMFTLGTINDMGQLAWDAGTGRLTLTLTQQTAPLFGEVALGRLQSLAKALDATIIVREPVPA